jgi:hypothetical protein
MSPLQVHFSYTDFESLKIEYAHLTQVEYDATY